MNMLIILFDFFYLAPTPLYQKVSICETIPKNEFSFWYMPDVDTKKTQLQILRSFKMRSACEKRSGMAKIVFKNEIFNVSQSLSTNAETIYRGSKSKKRFF